MNYGPITIYSHFNAGNPALNVVDTTSAITLSLQAGETRVRVGILPTTDGTVSRTVFVDGLSVISVGSATIGIAVNGPQLGTFQTKVVDNTEPPAADQTGATVGVEYPTPASR